MNTKKFPGQKDKEEIKLIIRKHWIINLKIFLKLFVLFIFPLAVFLSLIIIYWPDFFNTNRTIISIFFCIYLLFVLLIIYINWLNEELDVVIVTDERLIGVDQVSFLHRTISETSLVQIEDVKCTVQGTCRNVLGYGNLRVQTAARKILFIIENVAAPEIITRKILDLRDSYREKMRREKRF